MISLHLCGSFHLVAEPCLIVQCLVPYVDSPSVASLEKAIREYLDHYNEEPKPFVWTADADLILGKIQRLCERISNSEEPHGPQNQPQRLHR
jgi:hypothetical protein